MPGSIGGVASSLVTGDRGAISEEDDEALRRAGLTHLLSVSGLHVTSVVGGTMLLVLRLLALSPWLALRLPLRLIAAGVAALAAVGYTLLAGAEVPTIRSCVAALLILLALALGREAITMRLVATGAAIVLLLWPESLAGPSFQLSFAAVASIVALHESRRVKALLARARRGAGVTDRPRAAVAAADRAGVAGIARDRPCGVRRARIGQHGAFGSRRRVRAGDRGRALAAVVADKAAAGGIAPIAAGLFWIFVTPAPDLLVTNDGRHVAIRTDDGMALLRARAGDYVRDTLAENGGVEGDLADLEAMPNARCSADLCVADLARGGRTWRILATRSSYFVDIADMAPLCASADIAISDRNLPRSCAPRWLKLDRAGLARTGGVAITLDGPTVRTVRRQEARHPWRAPERVMPPRSAH